MHPEQYHGADSLGSLRSSGPGMIHSRDIGDLDVQLVQHMIPQSAWQALWAKDCTDVWHGKLRTSA